MFLKVSYLWQILPLLSAMIWRSCCPTDVKSWDTSPVHNSNRVRACCRSTQCILLIHQNCMHWTWNSRLAFKLPMYPYFMHNLNTTYLFSGIFNLNNLNLICNQGSPERCLSILPWETQEVVLRKKSFIHITYVYNHIDNSKTIFKTFKIYFVNYTVFLKILIFHPH